VGTPHAPTGTGLAAMLSSGTHDDAGTAGRVSL
jgi:hypothetical protein